MTVRIVTGHECSLPKHRDCENGDVRWCDECGTYWSYNPHRIGSPWRRVRAGWRRRKLDAIRVGPQEANQ